MIKEIKDYSLNGGGIISSSVTCTVEEGSYAQKYCEEKGIKYVIK